LTAAPDYVPDNVFADTGTPDFAGSSHRAKYLPSFDSRSRNPFIQRLLCPTRNGNGADMAALANQIDDGPVPLLCLDIIQIQSD
jgi:hypothetical protein